MTLIDVFDKQVWETACARCGSHISSNSYWELHRIGMTGTLVHTQCMADFINDNGRYIGPLPDISYEFAAALETAAPEIVLAPKEEEMINAINDLRSKRGLSPLSPAAELLTAARGHVEDMAAHPAQIVHIGSDGRDGGRRIYDAGYHWREWGEVVGWGYGGNVEQMLIWWQHSESHLSRILDKDIREIGVGFVTSIGVWDCYWTVNFGVRDKIPATPVPPVPQAPYTIHLSTIFKPELQE